MDKLEERRKKQCGNKEKYYTKKAARAAIKKLKYKFGDIAPMASYECPHCKYWHIGRSGKQKIMLKTQQFLN